MRALCRIGGYGPTDAVDDPQALAHRVFATVYMGTSNSSKETRERARTLAAEIGSYHIDANVDSVVYAMVALFQKLTGAPRALWTPRYHQSQALRHPIWAQY